MPTRAFTLAKNKRRAMAAKSKERTCKANKKKRKPSLSANEITDDEDKEFQSISDSDSSEEMTASRSKKRGKLPMMDRLLGLTETLKTRTRHLLIPALNVNQVPLENYEQLQDLPTCKFITPQPIYVANHSCASMDLCHQRTRIYDQYKSRLNGRRTHYTKQLAKHKKLADLEQNGVYSSHAFTFAERFNSDPDPYFYGCYDFYYTGGNLCVLPQSQDILHADGKNLNTLKFSKLTNALSNVQQLHEVCEESYDKSSNEIFEIRAFPTEVAENKNFIVRQHNELKLNTVSYENIDVTNQPEIDTLYCLRAKIPFISFTYIPEQANLLLSSNMHQQLRLYDLANGEPRLQQQFNINSQGQNKNFVNSWNIVRAYNEHSCVYANDEQLLIGDLRTTQDQWLKTNCPLTHNVYDCDKISCLAISQWQSLFYVGTAHHLHCLDLRKLKLERTAQSAVSCWTHQMAYPPAFIDTFLYNQTEFIAISSAIAGEVRICEMHKSAEHFQSTCLPYKPPTLKEAYHHAKLSGLCLQAAANMKQRLNYCTTGLTFLQKSHQQNVNSEMQQLDFVTELLNANSNGDIFAQGVLHRSAAEKQEKQHRVNEFSDIVMHGFSQTICCITRPVLRYTDICDMQSLSKVLRCTKLDPSDSAVEEIQQKTSRRRMGRWQKSPAVLKQFKDALAQDLLSIWDVEDERVDDMLSADMTQDIKKLLPTKTLVNNWLELGTLIPPPTTSIISTQCPELNAENMPDLPQSTQLAEVNLLAGDEDRLDADQAAINSDAKTEIITEINLNQNVRTIMKQTSMNDVFTTIQGNESMQPEFATIDESTFLTEDVALDAANNSTKITKANSTLNKSKKTKKTKKRTYVKGFG